MKRIFYSMLVCIFIISCKPQESIFSEGKTYENFRGFEPVDPIEYDDNVQIVVNNDLVYQNMKLLTPEQILKFLNNETVLVSIGQLTTDGGITYLPVTVSAKHSSYKVTMDYMKFATLGQENEDGTFIGFKRVGVGLRLISLITTFDANINIGDLGSIGVAAKAGKLMGTLMIEVVGIKSKDVTTLLPLPSEINQTTIQNAMQALATIKSKIYDSETQLFPQTMAIKVIDSAKDSSIKHQPNSPVNDVDNRIKLQVENNKTISVNKQNQAGDLEKQGFEFLFDKNIDDAIKKFDECENVFPQYHNVYEISSLLKKNRSNLSDKNSVGWKEVYNKILKDFAWKLPPDIKQKLITSTTQ